jgi:NADPH-dependent F420 reductase
MKIGIIGAGNIGGTLGTQWLNKGHDVMFGVRDKNNPRVQAILNSPAGQGREARLGSVGEAGDFGTVIVLAVPWTAVPEVLRATANLQNKILVDCTNPLSPGLTGLAIGFSTSAAEEIERMAKGARVVKAFNTLGSGNLTNLSFGPIQADTFICGNDDQAKSVVKNLAEDIGFNVVDSGPLTQARLLEPLAMLWISLAYRYGYGPDIAIKLLKR